MPASSNKGARMACSTSGQDVFIRQLEGRRMDCSEALEHHLRVNPDTTWVPEDGPGELPLSKREKARLKLAMEVLINEDTNKPILPPSNTRLTDELVYLATKYETNATRAVRWPYDFDKSGDIDPNRVPSGPAPIIWAHGMPFFPVYKGYYILCGREHATCIGWLLHEQSKTIMTANPTWSVGAVIAPGSAVRIPHEIDRQMICHKPQSGDKDSQYRGKAWARDFVASEHHHCAVLPSLDTEEITVRPLWKANGYNARCGPLRGVKPTIMSKEFFTRNGIVDIDYAFLARPYKNLSFDDDEIGEVDSDSDRAAHTTKKSAGTQSEPQMDEKMDVDSAQKTPGMGPEKMEVESQKPVQVKTPEQDTEEIKSLTSKEKPEEAKQTSKPTLSNATNPSAVYPNTPVNPTLEMDRVTDSSIKGPVEDTSSEHPRTAGTGSLTTQAPTDELAKPQTASEHPGIEQSHRSTVTHSSEEPNLTETVCGPTSEPTAEASYVREQDAQHGEEPELNKTHTQE